ncbi:hypothetical protein FJR04_00415 [Anabaena sp. UHCC 0204]|nr:hypothetical protein [Anabaena sp. UHCC 0204]
MNKISHYFSIIYILKTMLKSIKIENFRCFKSFELQQPGRINLLVGKNISDKIVLIMSKIPAYCRHSSNILYILNYS